MKLEGQFGQPAYLDMVLFKGQVKNGFFVEAGADDFETGTNTLYFEMKHGWTGLLVEPNPTIFPLGFAKQRKAWGAGTCLGRDFIGGSRNFDIFSSKVPNIILQVRKIAQFHIFQLSLCIKYVQISIFFKDFMQFFLSVNNYLFV